MTEKGCLMKEKQMIEKYKDVQIVRTQEGCRLLCHGRDYFEKCYDEITFDSIDGVFICRKKDDYDTFILSTMKNGGIYRCSLGDEHTVDGVCRFYYNGKFGCRMDGREILPPLYDDIQKWADCDVIYTRKGMDVRYFDLQGNEILKNRRPIEGAADHLEPYYCGEPQETEIVQTMDLSERPEGDDFCVCHGHYAGLSRRTRREHMNWIKKQGAEACKRFREITLLTMDCYIYSAYVVQSEKKAKRPVSDCLRQLERLGIFFGGWHVILTILAPQRGFNCRITKEEWKSIREMQRRTSDVYRPVPKDRRKQDRTDCSQEDLITIDAVFKGITHRITSGAMVLATLCFADHWPMQDEKPIKGNHLSKNFP